MSETWKLVIPRIPISQNTNEWKHRYARMRYLAEWEHDAWVLCKEQKIPKMEQVRLYATVYFPDRRWRDLDNYHAPIFKGVQDALEAACVIPKDNTRHIPELPGLCFGYDKKNPRTEIIVTKIECKD